ncbi:hypothetical protein DFJ73DRAFT_781801 [Zopfochytrium polystomum]|nr:hypothetical protein DFJ73DRAFT_781801 [Zopfochytrium polystomum]
MKLLFALSGLNVVGGKSWRKDARSARGAALFASFVPPPPSSPVVAARLIVWDNLRGNIA